MVKKIKSLCKARKIPVYRMEDDLGFSRNSIARWDKNAPSVDRVSAVAAYLSTTVDDLLKD